MLHFFQKLIKNIRPIKSFLEGCTGSKIWGVEIRLKDEWTCLCINKIFEILILVLRFWSYSLHIHNLNFTINIVIFQIINSNFSFI